MSAAADCLGDAVSVSVVDLAAAAPCTGSAPACDLKQWVEAADLWAAVMTNEDAVQEVGLNQRCWCQQSAAGCGSVHDDADADAAAAESAAVAASAFVAAPAACVGTRQWKRGVTAGLQQAAGPASCQSVGTGLLQRAQGPAVAGVAVVVAAAADVAAVCEAWHVT